jgi:integrase
VGVDADPNQTVGEYLSTWLAGKRLVVKPTTFVRYRDYVHQDLVPALGRVRLDELSYAHVAAFTRDQLAEGRGRTTVYRCLGTLSSALGEAVRRHRLPYNPVRPAPIPRPPAAERTVWTGAQAARFLEYCHGADPLFADLVEVLIGTGLRRGEALGLRWAHVDLGHRVLFVRWTLSAIDNHRLVLTVPKTKGSRAWVALSDRVTTALEHRVRNRGPLAADDPEGGYVFHRADGKPLHPQYVLNHFHDLCAQAGVPRITVHDLRHLTATLSMTAGVPLPVVSKTLRHATLSTTANIYSHLSGQAARGAVDSVEYALTHAAHDHHATTGFHLLLRPRMGKELFSEA